MVKEFSYTNIRRVLDELQRHPLLSDLTLEQVVSYTVTFIGIFGMPKLYQDKQEVITIDNYRGILPCDCVQINQVKDNRTGICLRSMTDNFLPSSDYNNTESSITQEKTFKTQGDILYVSFKTGEVLVSYKATPTDKEGYPLLIDNPIFLRTLEAYIKREVFETLFDMGKIQPAVLSNAQQRYAWLAGQLQSEFTIPSITEMESLKRSWCTMIQRTSSFSNGFKNNSDREYLKVH